ncbi:MAG: Virginiamycin B lyase [Myxococcota bacterium]|nr:Virginiamycin B lyase [Myxococcota bacterium]
MDEIARFTVRGEAMKMIVGAVGAFVFLAGASGAFAESRVWTSTADFDKGAHKNTNASTPPDQLTLNRGKPEFDAPYIYVSNSPDNTVSKLETATGKLVHMYREVCNDPSRTAVDGEQFAYAACRKDGTVAKLDPGSDKIVWRSRIDRRCNVARALAVDREGFIWVGLWDCNLMAQLSPTTGEVLQRVENIRQPYGAAADSKGFIYVANSQFWDPKSPQSRNVTKFNAADGQIAWTSPPIAGKAPYGIAVDHQDNPWAASWEGSSIYRLDPATGAVNLERRLNNGRGMGRGIAFDRDGNGWVALSCNDANADCGNRLSKFDPKTGNSMFFVTQSMNGPVGVALDGAGYIWAVNMRGASAVKIRAADGQVMGTFPTQGREPYTYSDMTGTQFNRISPSGRGVWTVNHDLNCAPKAIGPFTWNAETPGRSSVTIYARAASQPGQGAWEKLAPGGSLKAIGRYLEIKADLFSNDADRFLPAVKDLTVEWEYPQELCDGVDNNCNGQVDEGVSSNRVCATGRKGVCGRGREQCQGGVAQCVPEGVEGREICNYKDDDCDGVVDNGVSNVCGGCGPPPSEECNGRDDDCDGVVDNNATCPAAGEVCLQGQCRRRCSTGECPGVSACTQLEEGKFCLPECHNKTCPAGQVCSNKTGKCEDPCAGVSCPSGSTCRKGACYRGDCYESGCPDGEVCVEGACVGDPCARVSCLPGESCQNGVCLAAKCHNISCSGNQVCRGGECRDDLCFNMGCNADEICSEGKCVPFPCERECGVGRECMGGSCIDSPCLTIRCPHGSRCEAGECVADVPPLPPADPEQPDAGSGDGGEPSGDSGAAPPECTGEPAACCAGGELAEAVCKSGEWTCPAGSEQGACEKSVRNPGTDAPAAAPQANGDVPPEGCGCNAGSRPPGTPGWLLAAALLALVWMRWRRAGAG